MTLTTGELMTRLSHLGHQPRRAPDGASVTLRQPSRYYQDAEGAFELELELRLEGGGTFLQVLGPRLDRGARGREVEVALALAEVQSAFHLLRFTQDPGEGGLRPQLDYVCMPGEGAPSDAGLTALLGWASEIFDPALSFMATLARTGQRDPDFLAGNPPIVSRLQERLQDLQARVEATERELDQVRRPRATTSHILPRFI